MRQIWVTKAGSPEVLQVREAPDPRPSAGEVRIRVHASGINFADLMARVGLDPDAPKLPCVVGYEVSGTIDEVGAGVMDFKPGDRVFGMPRFGGYTDTLVLPSEMAFKMPSGMGFEEAAALPVAYLTAYNTMLFNGNLREGSSVLIHSAAGGVGLAAIEIAKTRNCIIYGTASESKHAFLRAQGCHHPIDSSGDLTTQMRAVMDNDRGIDLVLDPVGGKSWTDSYELLGPCGRLMCFGLSSASPGKTRSLLHAAAQLLRIKKWSPMRLIDDNKTVGGTNMSHLFGRLHLLRPQFLGLLDMFEAGQIKPRVDRTFTFEEASLAHHYLHDRKAMGKVLLLA